MTTTPTSHQFRNRAIGSLFFAGFGTLWIGLALTAKEMLTAANLTFVALALAVLVSMALWLLRESKRFPGELTDPAEEKRIATNFNRINAAEWTAGGIVAFTLARTHLDAYIPCAITAIVALHLFPLARLFGNALHYATGSVLLAWATLTAILIPVEHLQGTSAFGTGIVLWLSAFITLSLALTTASRSARTSSNQKAA